MSDTQPFSAGPPDRGPLDQGPVDQGPVDQGSGPSLALWADCGPGVGVGHLARCLALGQRWRDRGGDVRLHADGVPAFWAERFEREGIRSWPSRANRSSECRVDWGVVDGYRFSAVDLEQLGAVADRILVVADHGVPGLSGADLILDQNLPDPDRPVTYRSPEVLVGPRYALVRRELRDRLATIAESGRAVRSIDSATRTVLVSLGGMPPEAARLFAARVSADPRLAGVAFRQLEGLADVGPDLEQATIALSAAGSTTWELCAFGVPAVYLAVAENQMAVGRLAAAAGTGVYAGPLGRADPADVAAQLAALLNDPAQRAAMSARAQTLVDGDGVARVVARMWSWLLDVRPAEPGDAELLWRWASDPKVRANSFSPDRFSLSSHIKWFEAVLADPDRDLYVVERRGPTTRRPIGQIRFDRTSDAGTQVALVDVSVADDERGTGWGGALIGAGVRRYFSSSDVQLVEARVKAKNVASERAFVEADFDRQRDDGQPFSRYVRGRIGEGLDG